MAKAGSYLGRGLEDIPGKPFGWAWHEERHEIREHLKARGRYRKGWSELEISRIQRRIHKYRPSFKERQAAWLARQPKSTPRPEFSPDELERLVELFADANDPLTASIAEKAAAILASSAESAKRL